MNSIIQQITVKMVNEVTKKASSDKLFDLDALAAEVFKTCTDTAKSLVQAIIRARNLQLREDKKFRKSEGLTIKEKDRPRQIMTKLGMIEWERDYYYDKKEGKPVYPLDQMMGIRSYERIGDEVSAELLNRATEVSYARSADIVTGGEVSRQSVRNHLLKANIPEKQPKEEKKEIQELHLYADEDHVHLQKPGKEQGKQNQIVPLVTVTEGTCQVGKRRNRTIEPMHFVDENQRSEQLWKSVEGYISKAYDTDRLKHLYIHADGGGWVKGGLKDLPQVIHVMDGYHFYKELRRVSKRYPQKHLQVTVLNALKENDRKKIDRCVEELPETDEDILEFRTYLFGNWEAIRKLVTMDDIPGSCTEGQVSHILSERFSRNPMGWSRKGLGKLSKLRVYCCNGGKLRGKDLKPESRQEQYREYLDRFINENLEGATDWSIFEHELPIMNGNSGTQSLVKWYGTDRGVFGNILN